MVSLWGRGLGPAGTTFLRATSPPEVLLQRHRSGPDPPTLDGLRLKGWDPSLLGKHDERGR